ncbi:retinoic acid early transcript 1E [Arvicola amphibius]|uniref:retinoic acid early transcript 1E n=1 Tax=Arvicola amphibius TaxID=1047088 RepID=UPI001C07FA33|nr:retinoic acid early transcript 1E [Arvicola amphibius]
MVAPDNLVRLTQVKVIQNSGSSFPNQYTYYICLNFTIKARSTPWFEGQCSVNGEPILQYNESNFTPLGDHGKVIYNTKACTDFSQRQKDIGEEMRKQILNTEQGADKTMGRHTLQVTMESQYKQGQLTDSFWKFTMDGQYFFYFNPKNKTWGVIHDESRGIMEKWKSNRELQQLLATFSMGDSPHYLKQFLKHWKEMPSAPCCCSSSVDRSPVFITSCVG